MYKKGNPSTIEELKADIRNIGLKKIIWIRLGSCTDNKRTGGQRAQKTTVPY